MFILAQRADPQTDEMLYYAAFNLRLQCLPPAHEMWYSPSSWKAGRVGFSTQRTGVTHFEMSL